MIPDTVFAILMAFVLVATLSFVSGYVYRESRRTKEVTGSRGYRYNRTGNELRDGA